MMKGEKQTLGITLECTGGSTPEEREGFLTGGGPLVGFSMWDTGSRMLKGTNPIWLYRLRHFHQRLDDSITCRTEHAHH